MVFSSLEFIYLFLPLTLLGFFALTWMRQETGVILWLIGASLAFYANWSVPFLALLLGSVAVNYGLHIWIRGKRRKDVLIAGIVLNLATIAYFKYALFFAGNFNAVFGTNVDVGSIILPLGISFFTFQQIAFLVETYRRDHVAGGFLRYMLFVVFFPQLIAGPIVMQKETVPQFKLSVFRNGVAINMAVGITLFLIGLFKKVILADGIAAYSTPIFELADAGHSIPLEMSWAAAIGYTFQIYFDFSGYSDMALGLARMFGIRLPANFNSPYKATSIVDFWRRWHITLSTFLRDYLYIPLGGNRQGKIRRYGNLVITMLLGGLWHGASWNFIVWGGLHGFYLMINHALNAVMPAKKGPAPIRRFAGQVTTFLAVIIAWVFFRAETFEGAFAILQGMAGLSGSLETAAAKIGGIDSAAWMRSCQEAGWISLILLAIVWLAPNSLELTGRYRPALHWHQKQRTGQATPARRVAWRPSLRWSVAMGVVALVAIGQLYSTGELSEFIYYNF